MEKENTFAYNKNEHLLSKIPTSIEVGIYIQQLILDAFNLLCLYMPVFGEFC